MVMEELPVFKAGKGGNSLVPSNYTGIVLWYNNAREWRRNGLTHREDGPAFEFSDGVKAWYLKSEYVECDVKLVHCGNYIVLERGIPTDKMFGKLKLTQAKILTKEGVIVLYDNLPGMDIREDNERR
jgi:hypothetical protein